MTSNQDVENMVPSTTHPPVPSGFSTPSLLAISPTCKFHKCKQLTIDNSTEIGRLGEQNREFHLELSAPRSPDPSKQSLVTSKLSMHYSLLGANVVSIISRFIDLHNACTNPEASDKSLTARYGPQHPFQRQATWMVGSGKVFLDVC
jgi:hypothetical protein